MRQEPRANKQPKEVQRDPFSSTLFIAMSLLLLQRFWQNEKVCVFFASSINSENEYSIAGKRDAINVLKFKVLQLSPILFHLYLKHRFVSHCWTRKEIEENLNDDRRRRRCRIHIYNEHAPRTPYITISRIDYNQKSNASIIIAIVSNVCVRAAYGYVSCRVCVCVCAYG